jgi:hypothetical protein
LPERGRRVLVKWLDNDESTLYWNYDEEDFYYEAE